MIKKQSLIFILLGFNIAARIILLKKVLISILIAKVLLKKEPIVFKIKRGLEMIIKDIEVTSIIIIVAIVISALFIINLIDKKHKLKAETKRKAFHMSMGVSMLLLPYLFKNVISVGVLGLLAITGMLLLKHTKQ